MAIYICDEKWLIQEKDANPPASAVFGSILTLTQVKFLLTWMIVDHTDAQKTNLSSLET